MGRGLFQPHYAKADFRPTDGILYLPRIRRETPTELPPRPTGPNRSMPRQTEPKANNALGSLLQDMMPRGQVRSENTQAISGKPGVLNPPCEAPLDG